MVKIVAMTANAMDGDRATLLAAGMDDYIAKPFSMRQLTELVETESPQLCAIGSSGVVSNGVAELNSTI